ncbi:MAG: hypothetical protein LBC86_04830 [Oscillospiraceae bacterium]|jgi:hypothetical protein|nr:hypothetical protein [Oscillospiraceae bacterium]
MDAGFNSATLSLGSMASINNGDGLLSIKMLKKVMDANTIAAASVINSMADMLPPPAALDGLGGLMDVRA